MVKEMQSLIYKFSNTTLGYILLVSYVNVCNMCCITMRCVRTLQKVNVPLGFYDTMECLNLRCFGLG